MPSKCWTGSPPRMRGKASRPACRFEIPRITPAHAGKRPFRPTVVVAGEDHPRACGEKSSLLWALSRIQGSPPRMRGKVNSECLPEIVDGDHPRACGEKYAALSPKQQAEGSPPRMRGKVQGEAARKDGVRITPAHAGKSTSEFSAYTVRRDHPRACGEKPTDSARPALALGHVRITPAHAGKRGPCPLCGSRP